MKIIIFVFCLVVISTLNVVSCFTLKELNDVDIENLYHSLMSKQKTNPNQYIFQDMFIDYWNGTCQISCPNNGIFN
jgi:hypothetical protein